MIATDCIHVQGRCLSARELVELQVLIDEHPHWSRHGAAKALCQRWDWRTPGGELKTFAARSLLLKLAQRQQLCLPPVREAMRRSPWGLGRPELRRAPPAASPTVGSHFKQPAAFGVATGEARLEGAGAGSGVPAALPLPGLQSTGGHALALPGARRAGAGFGRASGGGCGLAVRAAGSLYRLERGGARGGLAPDWQPQSFSHFALGAGAAIGQPFIGRLSPAARGGLAGPARLATGAFGNLCGSGPF